MKWRVLFLAFVLLATTSALVEALTNVSTICWNLISKASSDFGELLLDGGITPTGGGDPIPGGGIPK